MTLYEKDGPGDGQRKAAQEDSERVQLAPGDELATRYRVIRRLGAGGMGAVYEVQDTHLEEEIALKILHRSLSADSEYRQRLRAEVRLARRVSHPNVCRVHDLGEHNGQLFVTMELIRGVSLRSKLNAVRRRTCPPLPMPRRVDIVVQLCSALSAAHRAGVLHRDVKPDNIVLESERAVLTDFGVASLTAELTANRRVVAGTPAYIAPEMLRGERYDHRADVYACAVVAYELLSGLQPFPTPNLDAAVQRARTMPQAPPLPVQSATPQAREALDIVLAKALCYRPSERYRSVDRLAEAFAQAARGELTESWAPPPPEEIVAAADTIPPSTLAHDQPTISASAPSVQATPPPPVTPSRLHSVQADTPTTTTRAQVRVATALHFECETGAEPTNATEMLPADWLDTRPIDLAHEGERLERTVVDLGGTPLIVSSFSITALFGAPTALGDDAARAARAAHALLQVTGGGRAGIDTARVLYRRGIDGPTASGEAISRAEALARCAAAGQVRASPAAARHLVGRFSVTELPIPDCNAGDPDLDRILLVEAGDLAGEEVAAEDRPLLGRDDELAKLEALVKDVCENRRPRRATILGPAGFGKSALRRELARRVSERREVDWLVGRATPLGEVAPLSLLRSADPGWFAAASQNNLNDRPAAFAAARRWLERRAARRPVVVAIEDAQWSDDASLEFFESLWQGLADIPIAILIFGRRAPVAPVAEPTLTGAQQELVVNLGPVADATALEIARRAAPDADDDELRDIVQRAGGNPFFVEELARDLRERDASSTIHHTPLPATVEAVVQGRLDRLPPTARELACAAAVVGREFWRDAARAALAEPNELSEAELDGILAELEHRAIVSALPPTALDDERYVFRSALVRDVAYQQLAPRDRRRAHAAIARWLEPRVRGSTVIRAGRGGADPTALAAIAMHRDLAGDVAGAREAYRAAGERSLQLFAFHEAANALRRARELTPDPDPELLEWLGDALSYAETIEAGERAYLEALEVTQDTLPGDLVRKADLCHKLSTCATKRADNKAAIDYCVQGLEYLLLPADREGEAEPEEGATKERSYAYLLDLELTPGARANPTVAASLYGSLGWVLGYVLTDNEVGLRMGERGVELLEGTSHQRELAHALSRLGANYMRAGLWRDQLDCNRRNLQIAQQLGDLEMQLTAHINLGVVYLSLGEIAKSIEHTRRGLHLARRTHSTTTLVLVRSNLAGGLLEQGALDEARDHLEDAIAQAERVGVRRILPESYGYAARLYAMAGDPAKAEARARHAVAIAQDAGLTLDEGIAARILARVLMRANRLDEAERLLERSRECLADSDEYENAKTTAARARFLSLRGGDGSERASAQLRDEAAAVFARLGAKRELEVLDDPEDVR